MSLNILITADAQGATNALKGVERQLSSVGTSSNLLQKQLERLQRIASLPGLSFKQLDRLNGLMTTTQNQIKRFDTFANSLNPTFDRVRGSVNSANFALINTGRVIQDLPFGFLGIANNLNPLFESFQKLKAESGSSRVALQQLGKSFLGAGGLGFALSIASTAVLLLTNGFQSFSRKAKAAKEDVDRLAEVLKELGNIPERVEIIAAGTTEETARVQALSSAVLDQTKSYKERNNALNELKRINTAYFGDLTLETASLGTLTAKVTEYTNAIIAAATVKAFADDIGKLNVEFAKQLSVFNKLGNEMDEAKRKLAATPEFTITASGLEQLSGKYVKASKEVFKATQAYDKQAKVLSELTGKQREFGEALEDAVSQSLKFKPLQEIKPPDTKELDKFIDETIRRARQFVAEFGNAIVVPDLSDSFFKTKDQIFRSSQTLLQDINDLNLKIRIPVQTDFDFVPTEPGLPAERVGKQLEEAMRSISGIKLEPFKFDPSILIATQSEEAKQKLLAQGKAMFSKLGPAFADEFSKQFADSVQKGLKKGLSEKDAIGGAALSIGFEQATVEAMTHSFDELVNAIGRGENAFASFGRFVQNTIKGVITQLVKAAAAAAVLSLITGGASGGGLSFIQALGKLFGGGRAAGGPVEPNKGYIVGERGPEWFQPASAGIIFNKSQFDLAFSRAAKVGVGVNTNQITRSSSLQGITGSALTNIHVTGDIKGAGRDLVLVFNREMRFQNRNV